ncbi:thiamine pyrophosphate-binding protein [Ktedonosporobacter rubrisoli]|uniref:Thiamine pyrophosphate-binding protein n=1 Tax=Ktedonosporobacter rubrisoli TaxID=2509675 RepID=A0A4P6JZZ3_KTERU|nr:thiamine pyrophosphate-binding protein [Ktedonosporobacter rubrisoli]QBD80940.1 thiamine pyrophosphate-binding protein [Ktedonosporobacter rubrisoli]
MQSLSAIHVLLEGLEELGVTHIFGVPGGPLVPLFEALAERERIRPVLAKHEEGAAFMAEGYARVKRGLGVCCATSGPGATNALTGIASAYSDSIPVLLLSAQVSTSTFGKGALQDSSSGNWNVDVVDIYRSATKLSLMLQNGPQMPHLIRRAIRTALTGRPGAVHLNLPADVVKQEAPVAALNVLKHHAHVAAGGDIQAIQQIAQVLSTARMPAVLAGHGINISGAWEPLQRVAEAVHMPVATTLKGKSAFSERHALSLGVFGYGGHPLADEYLLSDEVDVLLIVGTSLGEFQTHGWDARLAQNRMVIQIDIDPLEIGKNYPVDLSVVGDAKGVLTALAEALSPLSVHVPRYADSALEQMRAYIGRYYDAQELQGQAEVFKPQALAAKLNEVLPDEALLFVDNGNCFSWIGQYYEARQTGSVFMATNVASMGYAVAAAIGGKVAAPERPVVAVVGDAAFAMNGMEVHTAADYNIPVIWVVLNNGGHGMVYNGETLICGRSFASIFRKPLDISGIARSLGVRAFKASNLDEFEQSLRLALAAQEPCVIDALVDINEVPRSLRRRTDTLSAFFGQQKTTVNA